MIFRPHKYQERAIRHIIENTHCALWLDMGLGKTVSTLSAIRELKEEYLETNRVLVIAPKSVALNTWTSECAKWEHLRHLRVSVVMGTAAQRLTALKADADIYVTNRDNVVWLVRQYGRDGFPFDCVVIDEASSFKNPQSKRFKALRAVRPLVDRIVELTGTPSPNGLTDLWAQVYLLDGGKRLGRTLGAFRNAWFRPGRRNGAVVYEWLPRQGAQKEITDRLSDICLAMKADDWLDLPERMDISVPVRLDDSETARYKKLERELVLSVDDEEIEANTAAALTNKLLQFTGGAMYDKSGWWHVVSDAKLDALADLVEGTQESVLVYYQYVSERERILERLAGYGAVDFHGESQLLEDWNRGEVRVMLAHPASVAYGLNMQYGGRIIVWYTLTWNLELYCQANARLHRQGQTRPVMIYYLMADGTMDSRVMGCIGSKNNVQTSLLDAVKNLKSEYETV